MTKKLLSNKFVWLLLVFMFLLFPIALDQAPQTHYRSVVIAVGIDKKQSDYIFTTQILEPTANQGFSENIQVYSATGQNCLSAMQKLTTDLGKISGLSNTSAIIFSEEVAKEGIMPVVDFMIRSTRLNDNPVIIITQKSAKEVLLNISKIDNSFSLNLNSLLRYNGTEVNTQTSTMEEFLSNYYSNNTATLFTEVVQEEKSDDGVVVENELSNKGGNETQNSSNQAGGSTGSGESQSKTLRNDGTTALFVSDKLVATLSSDEIKGFSALKGANRGVYTLKNVTDDYMKNADVVLTIKQKLSKIDYDFSKNGVPRITYHLRYDIKIENIIQEKLDYRLLDITKNYLSKIVANKFKQQIASDVAKSVNIAKEYNADAFGAQVGFEKFRPIRWKSYLKTLEDQSKAFQNIEFFIDINVKAMT